MSVSALPRAVAARRGEWVGNRHYVQRFRCPLCRKPYAKRALFVAHLRAKACAR